MSTYLTDHFTREELSCRHCGEMLFSERAVEKLEGLRLDVCLSMPINSGYRCPSHNARVSSSGVSGPHTITAEDNVTVDVDTHGREALEIIRAAPFHGFTGYGLKQHGPHRERFVHLDCLSAGVGRPRPWLWTYP